MGTSKFRSMAGWQIYGTYPMNSTRMLYPKSGLKVTRWSIGQGTSWFLVCNKQLQSWVFAVMLEKPTDLVKYRSANASHQV